MPYNRFYIIEDISPETDIKITGNEFNHMINVIRQKQGDIIELINGRGVLGLGKITDINRNNVSINIFEVSSEEPPKSITLYQAVPRHSKLDFILEKGTELGFSDFVIFHGEKSSFHNIKPDKLSRLDNIIISSMKQSGRLHKPKLHLYEEIKKWNKDSLSTNLFFGDLSTTANNIQSELLNIQGSVGIVIGPESGLSDDEVNNLLQLGAKGVTINSHTLRTETASIAFIAIAATLI